MRRTSLPWMLLLPALAQQAALEERRAAFAAAAGLRCDLRIFQARTRFTRLCVKPGRARAAAGFHALLHALRADCRHARTPEQAEAPLARLFSAALVRNESCFWPALRDAAAAREQSLAHLHRLLYQNQRLAPGRARQDGAPLAKGRYKEVLQLLST